MDSESFDADQTITTCQVQIWLESGFIVFICSSEEKCCVEYFAKTGLEIQRMYENQRNGSRFLRMSM